MFASGQKQTFALQQTVSALLPKAERCGALAHVCFGSLADICGATDAVRFTLKSRHWPAHTCQDHLAACFMSASTAKTRL
jgi:hypothetical protein